MLSMPGAPLWVHTQADRLVAMFLVHMHGSPDDPLMSAFIQVGPSSAYSDLQHEKQCRMDSSLSRACQAGLARMMVMLALDGRLQLIEQQSWHVSGSCLESIWIHGQQAERRRLCICPSMLWCMLCRS